MGAWLDAVCAGLGGVPLAPAVGAPSNRSWPLPGCCTLCLVVRACTGGCLLPNAAAPPPAPKAMQRRWGKARPYCARVAALESLCRPQPLRGAAAKDTVRAELDLGDSGLAYAPGDALGILPLNCPQAQPCLSCPQASS